MPFLCRIEIVVPGTITVSVWAQCRQRRPRFCLIPLKRVGPSEVPSEKARPAAWVGAAKPNVKCALPFRGQPQRTHRASFSLKQFRCPGCGAAETLNCHSKLYGNDPSASDGKAQGQRGQRVWCCNRGRRGGCGRSFSIFLADVLPRHTVTGPGLWRLLVRLLAGGSIKAAVEALALPFALETLYHLLHRLARAPGGSALGALPGAASPAQFANRSAPPDGRTFAPPLCQERLPLCRLSTPLSTPALGVNQTAPAVPGPRPLACLPASHALRATIHLGLQGRAVGLIRSAGPCYSW